MQLSVVVSAPVLAHLILYPSDSTVLSEMSGFHPFYGCVVFCDILVNAHFLYPFT
jgi:hypothetical protein